MRKTPAYIYAATVVSVHDGDTITALIDVGLNVQVRLQKLRLAGIDAPELDTAEGVAARDALVRLLSTSHDAAVIQTRKDAKERYGRWLARVFATDAAGAQFNVNAWMVDNGFARAWKELEGEEEEPS